MCAWEQTELGLWALCGCRSFLHVLSVCFNPRTVWLCVQTVVIPAQNSQNLWCSGRWRWLLQWMMKCWCCSWWAVVWGFLFRALSTAECDTDLNHHLIHIKETWTISPWKPQESGWNAWEFLPCSHWLCYALESRNENCITRNVKCIFSVALYVCSSGSQSPALLYLVMLYQNTCLGTVWVSSLWK